MVNFDFFLEFLFIGMANMMPWLLSMSLLGFQQFAAHPGIAPISRELEAPIFPLRDSVQTQINISRID